jgi:hypothetical protein
MFNNNKIKSYTISIPVQINYENNDMSPESKTLTIKIKAKSTEEVIKKLERKLTDLVNQEVGQ